MIAAVIPAAGLSTRMGRPKLLLEIRGRPLIARVISALRAGGVDRVVAVVAPPSQEGSSAIREIAATAGAEVVVLGSSTADMRATVERGIAHLAEGLAPEGVLIAPADSVGIVGALVAAVVDAFRGQPDRIVSPVHSGRRGHPLALPWSEALAIRSLPPDMGVNALLADRHDRVIRLDVDFPGLADDLDTPEDYLRWSSEFRPS